MKLLIMLQGLPLSGKSTLAAKLKEQFPEVTVLKTTNIRELSKIPSSRDFDETNLETKKQKDESYKILLDQAKLFLNQERIVVLDATFHQLHRRVWVYEFVKQYRIPLLVIKCALKNQKGIQELLLKRRQSQERDDVLNTYEMYHMMKKQLQKITKEEIQQYQLNIKNYNWEKENIFTDIFL